MPLRLKKKILKSDCKYIWISLDSLLFACKYYSCDDNNNDNNNEN